MGISFWKVTATTADQVLNRRIIIIMLFLFSSLNNKRVAKRGSSSRHNIVHGSWCASFQNCWCDQNLRIFKPRKVLQGKHHSTFIKILLVLFQITFIILWTRVNFPKVDYIMWVQNANCIQPIILEERFWHVISNAENSQKSKAFQ